MDPVLFRWLALIVALGAILVSFLLRYHRLASLRICFILVSLLLIYKIAEIPYEISHSYYVIPYEVSHLAYYVVPLLLLSGLPGSDFASGALSLITGVGFLLGALIRPVTHELLFFVSLPLLFTIRQYSKRDYLAFLGMMAGFVIYFLLLKYRVIFPKEDFNPYSIALRVLDGSLVGYLTPDVTLGLRVLFSSFCLLLVFGIPYLLLLVSLASFKRRKSKGRVTYPFIPFTYRGGLLPLLIRCHHKGLLSKEKRYLLAGIDESLLWMR
jgi:hypothetical protein